MILLLLGAPGSGKGTVSSILIEKHGFRQISTGDLLRAEVKSGSKLGKEIDTIMKSGAFVSADLVNDLVKTYIKQYQEQGKNIVLDGYPRNIEQANFLSTYAHVDKAAQLVVDNQVLIDRISGRRVCPVCNFAYNLNTTNAYYPEVKDGKFYCKKCQVELIQRKDDNPETVKNRLAVYDEQTLPLVKYYNDKGVLNKFDSSKGTETLVKEILA